MQTASVFVPRRVGVCGGSKELAKLAVPFCRAVGNRLAEWRHVTIVSGGTRRRRASRADDFAADWHIVNAAAERIRREHGPEGVDQRIETIVTDDAGTGQYFEIGVVRKPLGKTREARRFSFVAGLDALFAVGGRGGTAQELALAMELGRHVLPVPMFGGTAAEFWQAYRDDLGRILRVDEATIKRWERAAPAKVTLAKLARKMVDALVGSLPRRCFVIMPYATEFSTLYDRVIAPVVKEAGDEPIRLDRFGSPGDVGKQVHDGIKQCDYAIAVLDGLRSNVVYELGLAHGYGKTAILMNRVGSLGEAVTPFDLSMQQRLDYDVVDARLVRRLHEAVATIGSIRSSAGRRWSAGRLPTSLTRGEAATFLAPAVLTRRS